MVPLEHQRLDIAARRPDGVRRPAALLDLGRNAIEGADVGLRRTIEVQVRPAGPLFHQRPQVLDGKDLPGENNGVQGAVVVLLEPPVLRQKREDGRHGVPHRDPLLGDEGGQPHGLLAQILSDDHDGGAHGERDVQVENRQIEMEWGVAAETIGRLRLEDIGGPPNKTHGASVRVHDPFGRSGGAGGVQDVRQIILGRFVAAAPFGRA